MSFEIFKTHEVAPDIIDFSKVAHSGFEFDITTGLIIIDMSTEASDMTVNETIFNATFV